MTTRRRLQRFTLNNTYLFALVLLLAALAVNYNYQNNLFELRVFNRNLQNFLPLMFLAAGQTAVIIGGGIDLSAGTIVTMINALIVTWITPESTALEIVGALILCGGAGMLAGVVNGFCVAYLRLQPIVTTYATSFIFSGIALVVLPRPGGQMPRHMTTFYRSTPLDIPMSIYAIVFILAVWVLLRTTRYGQYLFATGGRAEAAYTTGIPVSQVKFSTYVWSGLFAALAALSLTLLSGSGSPLIGGSSMTLDSIVAVVLGGTRLSGGQGGVAGSLIGVGILGVIRNIISFANVPTWSQTLVDALIIISALAIPGLLRLLGRLRTSWTR